jgi:hypothetical protein
MMLDHRANTADQPASIPSQPAITASRSDKIDTHRANSLPQTVIRLDRPALTRAHRAYTTDWPAITYARHLISPCPSSATCNSGPTLRLC